MNDLNTALIALNALNEALRQATAISQLIMKARTEGREISQAEIRTVVSERNAAIASLDAEIAKTPD